MGLSSSSTSNTSTSISNITGGCLIPGLPDDVAEECLIRVPLQQLSVLRSVSHRWRAEIFSPNFHRRRRLAGISQPFFLFSHNNPHWLSDVEEHFTLFDLTSGACYALPNFPNPPTNPLIDMRYVTTVGVGHCMVAINWLAEDRDIQIYDFSRGFWREGAPMPGPARRGFALYASDGVSRVFICGGYHDDRTMFRSVISYNLKEGRWESLPDMPEECKAFKIIFSGGTLYAFSTQRLNRDFCRMDMLDLTSGEWSVEIFRWFYKFRRFPNRFTIGGDGRIYFSHGKKVWVREGDIWRGLVDLPYDSVAGTSLISWKGGLLITPYPSLFSTDLEVHTLEPNEHNETVSWRLHTIDNTCRNTYAEALLEI